MSSFGISGNVHGACNWEFDKSNPRNIATKIQNQDLKRHSAAHPFTAIQTQVISISFWV
jgi:hypothetical protein